MRTIALTSSDLVLPLCLPGSGIPACRTTGTGRDGRTRGPRAGPALVGDAGLAVAPESGPFAGPDRAGSARLRAPAGVAVDEPDRALAADRP